MVIPKKVVAMHDMCSYGKSSLTVVIPVLSALNAQVCPVPTGLFPHHFGFDIKPTYYPLTDYMRLSLESWKKVNLSFDALYTGIFLTSEQFEIAQQFLNYLSLEWIYIDPVLGDGGQLYDGISVSHIQLMSKLLSYAHIISPNPTEAAFLLGTTPKDNLSVHEASSMLNGLSEKGPRWVIITGVTGYEDNEITIFAKDRSVGKSYQITTPKISGHFEGTGDGFASAVLGNLIHGVSFIDAVNRAVTYIYKSLKMIAQIPTYEGQNRELLVEPTLSLLMKHYQLATINEI